MNTVLNFETIDRLLHNPVLASYELREDCLQQKLDSLKQTGWQDARCRSAHNPKAEPAIAAALHNADLHGALLGLFLEDAVYEGLDLLANMTGFDHQIVVIPENTPDSVKDEIARKARCHGVRTETGLLDVRAHEGDLVVHPATAALLSKAYSEGGNIHQVFIAKECGSDICQPVPADLDANVRELLPKEDFRAFRIGYHLYPAAAADQPLSDFLDVLGDGRIEPITSQQCLVDEIEKQLEAARQESCGKCVFCREGLNQLAWMTSEIRQGRGKMDYLDYAREIGEAMQDGCRCSLGQQGAGLLLDSLEAFPAEFQDHIRKKKCLAGACFSDQILYVDPRLCTGCTACMDVCPKNCIAGRKNYIHMIDDLDCSRCQACMQACPEHAIISTAGRLPKLPVRLTKVGRFKRR